jgi:flavin reductase (DIM6/NTAB) family NADH-FMN oxidoreductase RutF
MYDNNMSIDPEALRTAMRYWATGVTIVSASYQGVQHGMTVSSFTSVSLEPPLVLVSLERGRTTHTLVERSDYFGVSILGQNNSAISDLFAGRHTENDDRFAGLGTFNLISDIPLLAGCLAAFDCRVVSSYEAGTHTLFIGEVIGVMHSTSGNPLIYFNQAYHQVKE